MKKLELVGKVPSFFVLMGICIQKTMHTILKITFVVFFTKKTVPVLPILNSGSFSTINSTITEKVLRISQKQKLKQEEITGLKHQLSHRGIFITKISTPKTMTYVPLQNIVNHEEKMSKQFPTHSQQT